MLRYWSLSSFMLTLPSFMHQSPDMLQQRAVMRFLISLSSFCPSSLHTGCLNWLAVITKCSDFSSLSLFFFCFSFKRLDTKIDRVEFNFLGNYNMRTQCMLFECPVGTLIMMIINKLTVMNDFCLKDVLK